MSIEKQDMNMPQNSAMHQYRLRMESDVRRLNAATQQTQAMTPDADKPEPAGAMMVRIILADLKAGGLLRRYKPPMRPGQCQPPSPEKLRSRRRQADADRIRAGRQDSHPKDMPMPSNHLATNPTACLAADPATQGKPLDQAHLRDIATQALESAFRAEMGEVMRGVVSGPPECHLEWLARAQHSVEQLLAAKHWIEHFSAPALPHKAQS